MWSAERSHTLARELVLGMGDRWSHLVAVGQQAERLAAGYDLVSSPVVAAAWLHDIGYAPELAAFGFHALDGARALRRLGAPAEMVALVGHHTGARYEAEERGLLEPWSELPQPRGENLDILTMIDLATSPTGQPVRDVDRVQEILRRYDREHPVCRAVTRSQDELLASSARAKKLLGLPDDWPVVPGEGMADS
jgi:putative nucleotidyltransferase with HDIG domain